MIDRRSIYPERQPPGSTNIFLVLAWRRSRPLQSYELLCCVVADRHAQITFLPAPLGHHRRSYSDHSPGWILLGYLSEFAESPAQGPLLTLPVVCFTPGFLDLDCPTLRSILAGLSSHNQISDDLGKLDNNIFSSTQSSYAKK